MKQDSQLSAAGVCRRGEGWCCTPSTLQQQGGCKQYRQMTLGASFACKATRLLWELLLVCCNWLVLTLPFQLTCGSHQVLSDPLLLCEWNNFSFKPKSPGLIQRHLLSALRYSEHMTNTNKHINKINQPLTSSTPSKNSQQVCFTNCLQPPHTHPQPTIY